jgi:hypothetical protein
MLARFVSAATMAAVLLVGLLAGAALAVEAEGEGGHAPLPPLEEVGTQSELSQQFFPEEAEEPVFAPFLAYPLLVIGILVALFILIMYLRWQPKFARETEKSARR